MGFTVQRCLGITLVFQITFYQRGFNQEIKTSRPIHKGVITGVLNVRQTAKSARVVKGWRRRYINLQNFAEALRKVIFFNAALMGVQFLVDFLWINFYRYHEEVDLLIKSNIFLHVPSCYSIIFEWIYDLCPLSSSNSFALDGVLCTHYRKAPGRSL